MPFMPSGKAGVGRISGSEIAIVEVPVSISTAQTTPFVESATRTVVGERVVMPFRNSAEGRVAVREMFGVVLLLFGWLGGKETV